MTKKKIYNVEKVVLLNFFYSKKEAEKWVKSYSKDYTDRLQITPK